jgi:Fe-S-cluster containining protein
MLEALLNPDLGAAERLQALYAWVDSKCASVAEKAVCKPGCAHCCRGPLDITQAEAALIAEVIGSAFTGNTQAAASPFLTPCPLLDAESALCTAYEVRPLACRTRFAMDDSWLCAKGALHDTYNLALFIHNHGCELGDPAIDKAINSLYAGFRADVRFFFG